MNSLITVASYSHSLQANIVKGRLLAEKIPASLANEQYINADWLLSHALGGVQLQVPKRYEKEAREMIDLIEQGQFETDNKDISTQSICPNCQSDDIISKNFIRKASFLSTNILHIPLPIPKDTYLCKQCQYQWSKEGNNHYSSVTIFIYIILLAMFFSLGLEFLKAIF